MADKFLIIDTQFRMSRSVEYHNELLPSNRKRSDYTIKGGGRFHIDDENKRFIIFGDSHEFNAAKKEDILAALEDTMLSFSLYNYRFWITNHQWLSEALKECNEREEDWAYKE